MTPCLVKSAGPVPAHGQELLTRSRSEGWENSIVSRLAPVLDELIDADGDLRADWIGTIAYFGQPAIDLAMARRWAVLGLIVHRRRFLRRELELEGAADLLRQTQREIVRRFRFPPTQAVVNVLAKVPLASAVSSILLAQLRLLVRDPMAMQTMAHLPRINSAVVDVLSDRFRLRQVVAPSLLRELAEHRPSDAYEADAGSFLFDDDHGIVDLDGPVPWSWASFRDELQRVEHRELPGRLTSIAQVRALHRRLLGLPDARRPDVSPASVPLPPEVPGQIESLSTAVECATEGEAMDNCAANRWSNVANGWSGLYRILADVEARVDRATLELGPSARTGWAIHSLLGVGNTRVSVATWQRVSQWLERHTVPAPTNALPAHSALI